MRGNWRLESALRLARKLRKEIKDPKLRDWIDELIDDIQAGIYIHEKRLEDLEMWSIRNPAFPGDMMGRPDDDFFDDDDEDEEDKDQKDKK